MIFKQATQEDIPIIWTILQHAIQKRKEEGSTQWQDGYPNLQTIENDIAQGYGYKLIINREIAAYAALIFNNEPTYDYIEGAWLSDGEFAVIHRIATHKQYIGQGYASMLLTHLENHIQVQGISSIKIDTNYDNDAMLKILKRMGYTHCGIIYTRGEEREAFEKLLPL